MNKPVMSNKTFLSDQHGEGGSIRWYVSPLEGYEKPWLESEACITDCSKTVFLNFAVDSEESMLDRIAKVDTLMKELAALKSNLKKGWSMSKKHSKKYSEELKKSQEDSE